MLQKRVVAISWFISLLLFLSVFFKFSVINTYYHCKKRKEHLFWGFISILISRWEILEYVCRLRGKASRKGDVEDEETRNRFLEPGYKGSGRLKTQTPGGRPAPNAEDHQLHRPGGGEEWGPCWSLRRWTEKVLRWGTLPRPKSIFPSLLPHCPSSICIVEPLVHRTLVLLDVNILANRAHS